MIRLLGQQWLHGMFFTEPNSEQAAETDNLFMFILWVTIISFIGVVGAMLWFVIRYRRRPGVPTQRSPSHHSAMELAWSIGPLIPMVFIFFWGFESYLNKRAAPADAEVINIMGEKWKWSPRYDNGAVPQVYQRRTAEHDRERTNRTTAPVIIIPAHRPVKLLLTSKDVIHAFFIPDFRTKIDVIPNRTTTMWFTALNATKPRLDENGKQVIAMVKGKPVPQWEDHAVFCAEYCGDDHSEMAAYIRVLEPDEYDRQKTQLLFPPPGAKPWEVGEFLWESQFGCKSCHSIDGKAGTGPSWKNIWGSTHEFSNAAPITLDTDEALINYVTESVYTPGAKLVKGFGNQMNSFQGQISPEQILQIVAFMKLKKVSPDGPQPAAAPAPAGGTPPADKPAEGTPAPAGGGTGTGEGGAAKPASP